MFHLQFLQSLGGNMLVDTFHVPDPAILTDPVVFFQTIDQQETREVAAQIAAMQTFTELGRPDLVKVSFQYAAEEGEHRLLGSYASGNRPPNNRGFAPKPYETVSELYAELQALGIIGGDGPAAMYPGPGEIDTSNVIETTPGGPMVVCMPPAEGNATGVVVLVAQLTGVAESGTYDADAFGFAKVAINADTGQICFRISVANIAQRRRRTFTKAALAGRAGGRAVHRSGRRWLRQRLCRRRPGAGPGDHRQPVWLLRQRA